MGGERKGKGRLAAAFHSGPGCGLHLYGMMAACVWRVTCVKIHVRGSALCSTCARRVSTTGFLLLLSGLTQVSRATHSRALPVPSICHAASFLSQLPDSLLPHIHTPQCPISQESARRQSLLATAIMSAWLWSIAVTGGLTAGTCQMSSTVVRSCWELQRGPWWPAQGGATSQAPLPPHLWLQGFGAGREV